MKPLGPARIIWGVPPGPRGKGKKRPMIIVSSKKDIVEEGKVFVVVCSRTFAEPLRDDEVRLPSHDEGKCLTLLRLPTIAVCNWTAIVPVESIEQTGGLVKLDLLAKICELAGIAAP